jgi:hypothetical protein
MHIATTHQSLFFTLPIVNRGVDTQLDTASTGEIVATLSIRSPSLALTWNPRHAHLLALCTEERHSSSSSSTEEFIRLATLSQLAL